MPELSLQTCRERVQHVQRRLPICRNTAARGITIDLKSRGHGPRGCPEECVEEFTGTCDGEHTIPNRLLEGRATHAEVFLPRSLPGVVPLHSAPEAAQRNGDMQQWGNEQETIQPHDEQCQVDR